MKLNHHSADFRRRLKQLNRDDLTRITIAHRDTIPVEQQMGKDELAKLHENILFTRTVMKEEAERRAME